MEPPWRGAEITHLQGRFSSRTPGKPDGPVAITLGVLPLASQALRGWSRLSERLPEVRQLRDA